MSWKGVAFPEIKPGDIPRDRLVSFDFETDGTKNYTPDMVSFSWETADGIESVVYDLAKTSDKQNSEIKNAILSVKNILAHNIYFEMLVCRYWDIPIVKLQGRIEDSMLCIAVWDTEEPKGLKPASEKYLGKKMSEYKEASKASREVFIEYCRDDSIQALKLFRYFQPLLKETNTHYAYQFELAMVWVFLHMYDAGFFVDRNKILEMKEEFSQSIAEQIIHLTDLAGEMINFNSTPQLRKLFYEDFGVRPHPEYYTAGGKNGNPEPGTGKGAIEDIIKRYGVDSKPGSFGQTLLDYKGNKKFLSAYLSDKFLNYIEPDGKIRSSMFSTGTATSRASSSDPNLMNLPARGVGKKFRGAFTATPGNKLLQIDYSQIEYRFAVHYMRDNRLIEAYKNNEDFHSKTSELMGLDDRSVGKTCNFCLIYGGGPGKLAMIGGFEEQAAQQYYRKYHEGLPNLRQLYNQITALAKMTGYLRMMSGRRRVMRPYIEKSDWHVFSTGTNTIIQGNAGELIKMAMIEILAIIPKEIKMVMFIHDELIFDGPEKLLEEFQHEVKRIMENVMEISVPIIAEPKIVNSWIEAKD